MLYFTGIDYLVWNAPASDKHQTIGPDKQFGIVPGNNNSSTVRNGKSRYEKIEQEGENNDGLSMKVDWDDVNISFDGINWFHFLGPDARRTTVQFVSFANMPKL